MKYKITESTKFNKPSLERLHAVCQEGGSGTQKIWRFKNGFGASVVQFKTFYGSVGSYTSGNNEWELAVIKFDEGGFSLNYKTKITEEVIGHLSPEEVEKKLEMIKKLKSNSIKRKKK